MSWSGRRSANSLPLRCSAISIRSSRVKRSASTSRSKLLRNLLLGLPAQLPGDDLAGPLPDAVGDVVAGDVEGLAVVGDAPDDDVGVGMAGVVVIDRDPVELGPEVGFHLLHQIARGWRGDRPAPTPSSAETMKRNWWRSSRPRSTKARPSSTSLSAE